MARVVAALVVVLAAGAVAAAVAFAAQSPKALRAQIFAAARKQHSVHYVDVGAAPGLKQTMVGDVAATRGSQRINFTLQGKKGEFTVLVVSRTVYLRGDAFALSGYLGFTSAQTSSYHGQWISIPPSSSRYSALAASVTLPSFLADNYPGRPLALVTTKIAGRKVTGVRGINREPGLKFVEALYPASRPPLLPREVLTIEPTKRFLDATRISRWNEAVHVQAPANAVPIATVQAG